MALDQLPSTSPASPPRLYPIGPAILPTGVHFRVWAPRRERVAVSLVPSSTNSAAQSYPLKPEGNGYFSGTVSAARAGMDYTFLLDDDPRGYPDPASHFQPSGPHGPSRIEDGSKFPWTDSDWAGLRPTQQVIYELHIGTFTPAGTWAAAAQELPALKTLGITAVEVMPVAESPGAFFWGYDGVNLFAPTHVYGTSDDFRRFVNTAHKLGIGVLLDVVYNHWGPDGNYLGQFSNDYASQRHENDWGEAINFDGPHSGPVREYFITNAVYWTREYHLDGLRLDATHQIYDASPEHLLRVIGVQARAAALPRSILLIAENDDQETRLVRPVPDGGEGLDSMWNDDFHHSARVALTGRREAYFSRYRGESQEFVALARRGFLYQGQRMVATNTRRGASTRGLPSNTLVNYLENHDQVAHSFNGARLHQLSSPAKLRAMTALLMLSPQTPMLFQGQEYGATQPFLYFADHYPELAKQVQRGRGEFLAQFPSLASAEMQSQLADPAAKESFTRCILQPSERSSEHPLFKLHQDLIQLRLQDPTFREIAQLVMDSAVLSTNAFVLRYFKEDEQDRLLLVNLGVDVWFDQIPEPLLAPPPGTSWATLWSSEDPQYGGRGTPEIESASGWRIPGHAAVVLQLQDEVRGLS